MNSIQMARAIEVWPVGRLKPYKRNARTHDAAQIDKIAASIVEFGFNAPILVDENDGIIAGHGRLLAAEKLGMAEVPVVPLTHMDEPQRRAYLIADNQLATLAGWDQGMLAAELQDLEGDIDLSVLGFTDAELEDLLEDDGNEAPGAQGAGDGEGGAETLLPVTIKMTPAQVAKFNTLGGDLWVRDRIDRARVDA